MKLNEQFLWNEHGYCTEAKSGKLNEVDKCPVVSIQKEIKT